MYPNVLRFNGKNYRVKIAKHMARKVYFEAMLQNSTLRSGTVFVSSLQLFTFVPTSIWIVSFIEMKVFRDLLGQASSKTVEFSFVVIKLMDQCGTVQLSVSFL